MNTQAIIFDFDGVILDTEHAIYSSWRQQYHQHGQDLAMSDWVKVLGMPSNHRDFHGELEALTGKTFDRDELKARRVAFVEAELKDVPPREGIVDYLECAKQRNLKIAVASGSGHDWVEGHAKQLNLHHYFDAFICREDTQEHKPYPGPFLAAAQTVGADPTRCIAIEDSPNGIRSAKAAGMFAVAYPTDMTRGEDFAAIEADRVVHSLADVPLDELLNGDHA